MSFSIKCAKCGCSYNPRPLVVETGEVDINQNKIYKVIDEDGSCPQCGFGSLKKHVESSTGGKKLLCD